MSLLFLICISIIWCGASFNMVIIHISYLVRCLSRPLAHYLIRLLIFLLLWLSLNFQDFIFLIAVLYQLCLCKNFLQSLVCLLIFFVLSFTDILINSSVTSISHVDCAFMVASEKSLPMMAFRWNLLDCL